jgi:SAM-dependent methyltransferase
VLLEPDIFERKVRMTTAPSIQELIQEYDACFHADPLRWDEVERDKYTYQAIEFYFCATGRKRPKAILDLGCGSGHTLTHFQSQWKNAALYGLDLSPEAIEFARRRLPQAHLVAGALGEVTFDTQFDVITVLGVLEHFDAPVDAIKKIEPMLTKYGLIYLEVPNCISYSKSEKIEGFRRLNGRSRQFEWHLFRPSWERLIAKSGLASSLSLKGPNRQVEFIWILTRQPEKISAYWKWRFWLFQSQKRLKRELTVNMKVRLVKLSRRLLGDSRYIKLRSMIRK